MLDLLLYVLELLNEQVDWFEYAIFTRSDEILIILVICEVDSLNFHFTENLIQTAPFLLRVVHTLWICSEYQSSVIEYAVRLHLLQLTA